MHAFPGAVVHPCAQGPLHGRVGRNIAWAYLPLTSGALHIKEGMNDPAEAHRSWSTKLCSQRNVGLDHGPCGGAHRGRVGDGARPCVAHGALATRCW
jgi:hypothetical protein